MKTIAKQLNEIQRTLKAHKSNYNSFAKFNYRSCEDILEALKNHLSDDLIVTLNDEMVVLGNRFYVKATATLSNGEASVSVSAFAREEETKKGMDGAQITGSASSYARKYALSGLFCIDDNKDADTHDNRQKDEPTTKKTIQSSSNGVVSKPSLNADNLSIDQVQEYVIPWGKFKDLTLKQISAQQTQAGVDKGIQYLEWLVEQDTEKPEIQYTKDVVNRFLSEVIFAR